MIHSALSAYNTANIESAQVFGRKKVLSMVKDEQSRTAGSMPKWDYQAAHNQKIGVELPQIIEGQGHVARAQSLLAYGENTDEQGSLQPLKDDSFGFGDLVDMINPFHHIPVLGHLYRNITGDEIKPMSGIVGGGIFGGPVGAGVALVSEFARTQTGNDLMGHAQNFVQSPSQAPPQAQILDSQYMTSGIKPSSSVRATMSNDENSMPQDAMPPLYNDLPVSLLAFTDNSTVRGHVKIESISSSAKKSQHNDIQLKTPFAAMQSMPNVADLAMAQPVDNVWMSAMPLMNEDKT